MVNLEKSYNDFKKVVEKAMKTLNYKFDLVIYGSTANGLSLRGDSDLDLSLVID